MPWEGGVATIEVKLSRNIFKLRQQTAALAGRESAIVGGFITATFIAFATSAGISSALRRSSVFSIAASWKVAVVIPRRVGVNCCVNCQTLRV